MTKYIEATSQEVMTTFENMVNAHLPENEKVVEVKKHLTLDKWLFNYDLFISPKGVGADLRTERDQQIKDFIENNNGIDFVDYEDIEVAGYQKGPLGVVI
jgi:hypothetical protein